MLRTQSLQPLGQANTLAGSGSNISPALRRLIRREIRARRFAWRRRARSCARRGIPADPRGWWRLEVPRPPGSSGGVEDPRAAELVPMEGRKRRTKPRIRAGEMRKLIGRLAADLGQGLHVVWVYLPVGD